MSNTLDALREQDNMNQVYKQAQTDEVLTGVNPLDAVKKLREQCEKIQKSEHVPNMHVGQKRGHPDSGSGNDNRD